MIALYIVAIIVVCGAVVFYFFWMARKRKRSLDKLKIEKGEKPISLKKQVESDLKEIEQQVVKEEKVLEAELEDFYWDDKKQEKEVQPDEALSFGGDEDMFKFDENLFETKIESYEQFLKEEQDHYNAEEELSSEEQNDIDALMGFDFESLKGKSREQVIEMIKDLSPTVQDFILNDVFDRKNNED